MVISLKQDTNHNISISSIERRKVTVISIFGNAMIMLKKIITIIIISLIGAIVLFGIIFFLRQDVQVRLLGETLPEYWQTQQQNVKDFEQAFVQTLGDVE